MNEKKRSVGGLWKRSGQYGEYLSGQIEIGGQKYNFHAYDNRFKQPGDKKPDFQIFPIEPKKQEQRQAPAEDDIGF